MSYINDLMLGFLSGVVATLVLLIAVSSMVLCRLKRHEANVTGYGYEPGSEKIKVPRPPNVPQDLLPKGTENEL